MSERDNLARQYEFERFDERGNNKDKKVKLRVRRGAHEAAGSAPKTIFWVMAAGVILGSVVFSKVENTQLHNDIRNENAQIKILQDENVRMQSEIEGKSALGNVEDYAENVLGLKKLDKSQIEYIKIEKDNVIEIPEVKDDLYTRIKNAAIDFWEYISG